MLPNILELTRQATASSKERAIESVEEHIPATMLSVLFADAQRKLDTPRVTKIAEDIDDTLLGHVVTSLPGPDGICHVIDGQHRVAAIRKARGETALVRCHMTDVAHDDHERLAWLFAMLNSTRKKVGELELFLALRAARSDDEVRVGSIVSGAGMRVGTKGKGNVSCPTALLAVYHLHGAGVLAATLDLLRRCYGDSSNGFSSPMVRGFARFLADNPSADHSRVVKKVAESMLADPLALQMQARIARQVNSLRNTPSGVAFVLKREYNHMSKKPLV